jgi:hypothetical protein
VGGGGVCQTVFDRATNTIGLYSDTGVLSTKPLGSSAALQNSQCAIGYSVVNYSGRTATLSVQIVFKSPAFSGSKTVAVSTVNPWGSTAFTTMGIWTVP